MLRKVGNEMLSLTRDLKVDMTGDDVRALQTELTQLGLIVPAAESRQGSFGPGTRDLILNLQKQYGLPTTGIVDTGTSNVIKKLYKSPLVVSPFGDGKYWYLREPLTWLAASGKTFEVPKGFVTDFASVPRPIWWLFPPWAKYGNAAVLHDYCYWEQNISRKEADAVILEGMKDLRVSWLTRQLIYRALRLFGWIAWWGNKREKAAKHLQVIDKWPESATTTWEEFRKKVESRAANRSPTVP
jgi:peptidoglycan hydrolase-like protein with peptidoglycan-binding domain